MAASGELTMAVDIRPQDISTRGADTLRRSRLRRRLDHTQGASRGPTASPRAVLGATARCQRGCRPQGRTVCRRADARASTATVASCCNRVRTEKGSRREDPAKKISSENSTAGFEHRDCENRNGPLKDRSLLRRTRGPSTSSSPPSTPTHTRESTCRKRARVSVRGFL